MSSTNKHSPFSQFSRVAGRYNSLAPFYIMSGNQQLVTGNKDIEVGCFHSKVYITDNTCNMKLGNGYQDGQLKKLTLTFVGNDEAKAIIDCPSLTDMYSQIVMSNVGDTVLLMWTGGSWNVLETMNFTDPTLNTPIIE